MDEHRTQMTWLFGIQWVLGYSEAEERGIGPYGSLMEWPANSLMLSADLHLKIGFRFTTQTSAIYRKKLGHLHIYIYIRMGKPSWYFYLRTWSFNFCSKRLLFVYRVQLANMHSTRRKTRWTVSCFPSANNFLINCLQNFYVVEGR